MRSAQDNRKRPSSGAAWLLAVLCVLLQSPLLGHWYERDGTRCLLCPNFSCLMPNIAAEFETDRPGVIYFDNDHNARSTFVPDDLSLVPIRQTPHFPSMVAALSAASPFENFPQTSCELRVPPYFAHAPPLRIVPTTAPRAPPCVTVKFLA